MKREIPQVETLLKLFADNPGIPFTAHQIAAAVGTKGEENNCAYIAVKDARRHVLTGASITSLHRKRGWMYVPPKGSAG